MITRREIDRKDVDHGGLTTYWRPFGTRPLALGLISPVIALTLFILFSGISILLILTIEPPHAYILLGFH
jgi:4-hydroxybenzoate polyprenyltransferase